MKHEVARDCEHHYAMEDGRFIRISRADGIIFATPGVLAQRSRADGIISTTTVSDRQRLETQHRRFICASRADGIIFTAPVSCTERSKTKHRRFVDAGRADGIIFTAPVSCTERGYTLIEVIVAFALLALALTLLLGTLSGGARQVRQSADAGRAALYAESLLAQAGVGESLKPGRSEGEFEEGRYRWSMEVAPYVDPIQITSQPITPSEPQLMHLQLEVQWRGGGPRERLQVESLRLVAPAEADQGFGL